MSPRPPSALALALAAAVALAPLGCGKKRASAEATADTPATLPTVRDDTQGLYFTWIDEKGEFHTEERAKDVPLVGRDLVRIVDPSREDGDGDVTIADLRNTRPVGTYPVRRAPRREREDAALARRKKAGRVATADPPSPPPGGATSAPTSTGGAASTQPVVIIYGASWCGPCHQAQAYLKKRGVPFVEKDIEDDPGAAAEMQKKLQRAGIRGGSIPVIDVKGKILVGFSPGAVDAALRGG